MSTAPTPSRRYCAACGHHVDEFGPGPNGRPDARCPRCRALERHRFLALLLDTLDPLLTSARVVLDIAPQKQIRRLLHARVGRERVVGMDIEPVREVDLVGDVRALPLADGVVDLVLCYHVFEHVPDDRSAMREVVRTLTSSGVAIVSNPRRKGRPTDEDPSAPVEERIRRFGREDHVRRYGDDFEDRLREEGFAVDVITPGSLLEPDEVERHRLMADEEVWLCRRADGALDSRELMAVRREPPSDLADLREQQLTEAIARARHELIRARREADEARMLAEGWRRRYETIAEHPVVRPIREARRVALRAARRMRSDD